MKTKNDATSILHTALCASALCAAFAGLPAAAQTMPADAGQSAERALPQVRTQGQTTYLEGGAGDEELRYLRQQTPQYNLRVLVHGDSGEYVAADSVVIKRGSQTVLALNEAGPYVLAQLPAGRYTVEATYKGAKKTRAINLKEEGTTVDVSFPLKER
jgi:hypothetical protein